MNDPQKKTSAWAIASFCCSLAGILIGVVAIAGIVFGHIAVREMRANPQVSGRGLAKAGLIIGYVVVGVNAIMLLIGGAFLRSLVLG